MRKWLVMYGRARALRARYAGGGTSFVKAFADESAALAFAAECERAGYWAKVRQIG
jgi:hypothetical protein